MTQHCTPFTRSLQAALTTATLSCTASLTASSDDFSQSCMLLRGWSPRHPTLRAHHTDTAWHTSLAADITAYDLQNCADDVRLFSRPMSEVLWLCVHSCIHAVAARSRLRSADHGDIVVPNARYIRFGCRSFRVWGATIWNKLAQNLRSTKFKRRLNGWLCAVCVRLEARLIGVPYKWTYLLSYLLTQQTLPCSIIFSGCPRSRPHWSLILKPLQ